MAKLERGATAVRLSAAGKSGPRSPIIADLSRRPKPPNYATPDPITEKAANHDDDATSKIS
jgi:hypothetical protein